MGHLRKHGLSYKCCHQAMCVFASSCFSVAKDDLSVAYEGALAFATGSHITDARFLFCELLR